MALVFECEGPAYEAVAPDYTDRDRTASLRCAGSALIAIGIVAGVICTIAGAIAAEGASAIVVTLLVVASCTSGESTSISVVGSACFVIGFVLGSSSAAVGLDLAKLSRGKPGLVPSWPVSHAATDAYALENALRLPLFLSLVMLFHIFEFLFVAACHPSEVSFGSLMLRPVPYGGYAVAMIAALFEFWFEATLGRLQLVPSLVANTSLVIGACCGICGWALRVAALFTAQANFTHQVAVWKRATHQLVTGGVYRLCRHPGYVGWFCWSVSTQFVLGNWMCLLAFTAVSWRFFAGRIPEEEEALLQFFGDDYLQYAQRVPCGLPFISELP
eukprot:TRINITY_DN20507_c0_g1_i1.p1 TRINITY_DN20507_c0_g1~~TRINITY_DN20507_c0_g1_i1.p1  ORF type:complete len:330 (+),score=40.82 TRINITY_DN20507_c0_g1_i1:141-1130(+)